MQAGSYTQVTWLKSVLAKARLGELTMRNFIQNFLSYRGAEWQAHFYCFQAPCYVVASTMSEFNLLDILWERASAESADFAEEHLGKALVFSEGSKFLDFVEQKMCERKKGYNVFSFGVPEKEKELIKHFKYSYHSNVKFRSLTDAWKGNHSVDDFDSRVTSFSDIYFTLESPKPSHVDISSAGLIYIRGGVFDEAKIVLEGVEKNLKQGVLILFGELIGYPNWRNGQYRAWKRIVEVYGLKFRYLGFCNHQALVEIID